MALDSPVAYSPHAEHNVSRRYTREDADSLVGGDSLENLVLETKPADAHKKVFSFSLPLGGLSGLQLKFPFSSKLSDPEVEQLRLRLERHDTLSTLDEDRLFAAKATDDVRFRAVKHLLKENFTDILPDFIKKDKSYEAIFAELSGPVAILGGYRGSILRDARNGKRVWIPLKAGLNLRRINLLLGPSREDELHATDYIYPDGMLKNVGPFDISKKLMKKLAHNPNVTVRDFGYDWRLSLDLLADKLIEFLEGLRGETGRPTIVIAHSMGGLVAHGALQKRPELFRGLVYVGSPSECLNILGPLRYGDLIMLSDRILTFETNFMMRSLFAFLPLHGRVFANIESGEFFDLDYFDPDTWVEYNLNPLVLKTRKLAEEAKGPNEETVVQIPKENVEEGGPLTTIGSRIKILQPSIARRHKPTLLTNLQMQKRHKSGRSSPLPGSPSLDGFQDFKFHLTFAEAYDYLCDTLRRTKEYVLGLEYKPELEDKYPPLAVVYGNTIPSVRGSNVRSPQDIKDGNYYEFFYGPGDGVVHERWLMPEKKGFKHYDPKTGKGHIVGKFASDCGHVSLMTDFKVIAEALSAIVEAEKNWKKNTESDEKTASSEESK